MEATKRFNRMKSNKKSNKDKNLTQKYEEVIGLKQECYNKIFKKAEEKSYCTKDGIIIKRSEIPYIFFEKMNFVNSIEVYKIQ